MTTPSHSKDFYTLSSDEKLNRLYEITAGVADGQMRLYRLVDPVQGPRRVMLTAATGLLGGAAVQVAFLLLWAVSCR